jgi:hypothetical protein
MLRDADGTHTMVIEPAMGLDREASGEEAQIRANTERFAKRLEGHVLKRPGHYLNFLALRTFMERQGDAAFFVKERRDEGATRKAALS